METDFLLLSFSSFIIALVITGLVKIYAIKLHLIDIPNQRSSHKKMTPRGGGISFVITFIIVIFYLFTKGMINDDTFLALLGSGLIVATIGLLDDRSHIPAFIRLIAHIVSAIWLVFWLNPSSFLISTSNVSVYILFNTLIVVSIIWFVNLYNFMDGIDGIAGIEAITICAGALVNLSVSDAPLQNFLLPAILMFSVSGFLFWNYPKAKIFMGDVGSGFLGVVIYGVFIHLTSNNPYLVWSWIILVGVFMVDATTTLLRRLIRGEKPHQAHRTHAYQHAARHFNSHSKVSITVGLINLLWLIPLSLLVTLGHIPGPVGVVVAYTPLLWLAVQFNAGKAES